MVAAHGFTMLPNGVAATMAVSNASRTDWAVLVCLLRYRREGGTYSVPASSMARELGRSPGAVRSSLSALARLGIIERVSGGHNGRTAVYRLAGSYGLPDTASDAFPTEDGDPNDCDAATERRRWDRAHDAGELAGIFDT